MLEEQITKLNSSIIELTAVLLNMQPGNIAKPQQTPSALPQWAQDEKPSDASKVSRDNLTKMCLGLVRKDPSNKDKLKQLILDHGGDLIKDVPEDKLSSLKAALGAL